MNVEPVLLIWESEFSALVRDTYGRPYQLQQQGDMLGQNSMVRVRVPEEPDFLRFEDDPLPTFKRWLAAVPPGPQGEVWDGELFSEHLRWDREFYPDLQDVVNDLHARGFMGAGDYVIHVWW